jgi:hypothetical protein
LTAQEKNLAVKEFWAKLQAFGNAAQASDRFIWSLGQDQLNRYLASMDEIASTTPSGKPGEVYRGMETLGLTDPVVALHDNLLTLMVHSRSHDKVFSVDLSFSFETDEKLRVRLTEARVGRLSLPNAWVQGRLDKVKKLLASDEDGNERTMWRSSKEGFTCLSAEDVASVLGSVLAAIDEEPISPELTWPVNKKRVRIENVEIGEGFLQLRVLPMGRKTSNNQSSESRRKIQAFTSGPQYSSS